MTIGRMILINSVLRLLMLGTPQAANITVAGATNFPMPGKGIAALFRQKNRHDTLLSIGASGEPFGQNNKPCNLSCFVRPTAFCPSRFGGNGLALEPGFICGTCRLVLRRSNVKFANGSGDVRDATFSQNCRPSLDSRFFAA